MLRMILLLCVCSLVSVYCQPLETVSDEELINFIKTERYVVTLFASQNCEACNNFENQIISLRKDLENLEDFPARIVKAVDSQLFKLYSPDKEPQLIYFRHGMPLLYHGSLDSEEILHTFIENKEPTVKELTDDTFEHLTQASSGATTGDWFVMFHSSDCVECVRMMARWEAVGVKLKQRVNIARINKRTTGSATARRFNVEKAPDFILFRHGKMYRYQIPKYDVDSFVLFAKEWYKNARAETVPVPQTPFDELVQMIANLLRENPWIMKLGSISIGVFIIISVASKFRHKTEAPQKVD